MWKLSSLRPWSCVATDVSSAKEDFAEGCDACEDTPVLKNGISSKALSTPECLQPAWPPPAPGEGSALCSVLYGVRRACSPGAPSQQQRTRSAQLCWPGSSSHWRSRPSSGVFCMDGPERALGAHLQPRGGGRCCGPSASVLLPARREAASRAPPPPPAFPHLPSQTTTPPWSGAASSYRSEKGRSWWPGHRAPLS